MAGPSIDTLDQLKSLDSLESDMADTVPNLDKLKSRPRSDAQPDSSIVHETEDSSLPRTMLSKNQIRKQKNYERRLKNRAEKRARERQKRKLQRQIDFKKSNADKCNVIPDTINYPKPEIHDQSSSSLPKVVIDCQYENQMTLKEQNRFAQQLRRIYSSNRKNLNPLQLYFTSLSHESNFYKICCKQNDGFAKYNVNIQSNSFLEVFSNSIENLVYLSPDSPNELESVDPNKIYIIGGLVDETVTKNISFNFTQQSSIYSAKLPIEKYFRKSLSEPGRTFKQILTVNQVFDIILKYQETQDWTEALKVGLPTRTGFVPINDSENSDASQSSQKEYNEYNQE